MGVYAPSPGTIYPRLARLEEDGLVTHEEVDGKKVYSITDKGREEIRARLGDLADLEDELTESLRDVAREISEDVGTRSAASAKSWPRPPRSSAPTTARASATGGPGGRPDSAGGSRAMRPAGSGRKRGGAASRCARFPRSGTGRPIGVWQHWSDRSRWSAWSDWRAGEDDRASRHGAVAARPGVSTAGPGGRGKSRRGGPNPFSDLERIAIQFANELRAAATQTGELGERSLSDLRDILTDTLAKVRMEVFTDTGRATGGSGGDAEQRRSSPDDARRRRGEAGRRVAPAQPTQPDDGGRSQPRVAVAQPRAAGSVTGAPAS